MCSCPTGVGYWNMYQRLVVYNSTDILKLTAIQHLDWVFFLIRRWSGYNILFLFLHHFLLHFDQRAREVLETRVQKKQLAMRRVIVNKCTNLIKSMKSFGFLNISSTLSPLLI